MCYLPPKTPSFYHPEEGLAAPLLFQTSLPQTQTKDLLPQTYFFRYVNNDLLM